MALILTEKIVEYSASIGFMESNLNEKIVEYSASIGFVEFILTEKFFVSISFAAYLVLISCTPLSRRAERSRRGVIYPRKRIFFYNKYVEQS